jgi:hypothetical protein
MYLNSLFKSFLTIVHTKIISFCSKIGLKNLIFVFVKITLWSECTNHYYSKTSISDIITAIMMAPKRHWALTESYDNKMLYLVFLQYITLFD